MNLPFSNWTPGQDFVKLTNSLLGGIGATAQAILPGITGGTTTTQTTGGTAADKSKMNTPIIVGVVVIAVVILVIVLTQKNKS